MPGYETSLTKGCLIMKSDSRYASPIWFRVTNDTFGEFPAMSEFDDDDSGTAKHEVC